MKIVEIEGHDLSYFFIDHDEQISYQGMKLRKLFNWHGGPNVEGAFLVTSDGVVIGINMIWDDIQMGVVLFIHGDFHVAFASGINMDHIVMMVRVGSTILGVLPYFIDVLP